VNIKCSSSRIRYYMAVGEQDFGLAGGLPLRYARDLRPLTAITLDAIPASLHTPLRGPPPLRPASTFPNI